MTNFKTTLQQLDETLKQFPFSVDDVNKLLELEEACAIADATCELKIADAAYEHLKDRTLSPENRNLRFKASENLHYHRAKLSNLVIERLEKLLVD